MHAHAPRLSKRSPAVTRCVARRFTRLQNSGWLGLAQGATPWCSQNVDACWCSAPFSRCACSAGSVTPASQVLKPVARENPNAALTKLHEAATPNLRARSSPVRSPYQGCCCLGSSTSEPRYSLSCLGGHTGCPTSQTTRPSRRRTLTALWARSIGTHLST